MVFRTLPFGGGRDRQPFLVPLIISMLGHALIFGFFAYTPRPDSDRFHMPSLMDVHMVDLGGGGTSEETRPIRTPEEAAPAPEPDSTAPAERRQPVAAAPEAREAPQPEISLAPQPPQVKTALKYQTRRTPEPPPQAPARQRAERVQPPAPDPPVNPLQETIRRLREQVEKEGRPAGTAGEGGGVGTAGGGRGGFGPGGGREIEAIDLYRLEVAFTIQKNWAFAEQLTGGRGGLMASIVFKVLPDGRIEDIFFTDRSGNPHLDESAYRAIVKSSPVRPHPGELNHPYIEMGLRFTPRGVQ